MPYNQFKKDKRTEDKRLIEENKREYDKGFIN